MRCGLSSTVFYHLFYLRHATGTSLDSDTDSGITFVFRACHTASIFFCNCHRHEYTVLLQRLRTIKAAIIAHQQQLFAHVKQKTEVTITYSAARSRVPCNPAKSTLSACHEHANYSVNGYLHCTSKRPETLELERI